ncbi:proline-rich spliceosome-associated (PSP) family protein [Raphanus sativus]|nr:proline-rich spliceosome-associated (PSP) family protein [Raphanus sativus]
MTVESTTVAHGNTTVVPNGDASNGNIIPTSKKPRESDRGRRRRRKQKKKSNKASSRAPDVEEAEADPQQPQVCEQIEIEYVLEQPELEDAFSDEFKQIFDKFSFREPVASEEDEAKKDESEENKDEDDEEKEEKVMISKKQKKVERRMKIGELKQESARPDVVEVWDATSAVPKLLVFLKSCRNTVPVPRHWSHKRKYLQGKRGVEKAPFRLPDFIAATGIQEIRQAYIDGNKKKLKLKQKQREERMQPKMGKMEIDYQVRHDAFFKYQTKPKLSALGDLYFEGKEFEVKPRRETRPGTLLSHGLKEALGLAQGAPPPWLINIFGVQQQDQPNYEDEPIDKSKHWGDLEEEEEEEEEEEMEEEEELEDGMESVDTMSSIETPPDAIELRKEQRKEPDRALYQVLEEEKGESVAPGTLLAPTHTYVIKTATQDKSGAKRVDLLKGHKKTDRVDVSLRPEELEALENVLPAKYEEAREEEKLRNKPEDFSDMVAENNSKKRKRDKEGKKKRDFKF